MSSEVEIRPYLQAAKEIKNAILKSRYIAACLVNKEMILLYYFTGKYVSLNTRNKNWGSGAIESISSLLKQELHGLRGFSSTNLKNMRIFYEAWADLEPVFSQKQVVTLFDFMGRENRQTVSDELKQLNRQTVSDDFDDRFFSVGFSHHISILQAVKQREHQWFYVQKSANEFWTHERLVYHLRQQAHLQTGKLSHNFDHSITESSFKEKALMAFRDEMFLDFINIEDADEEPDERIMEQEIVQNIKKFIMAFGTDFSFIGNQFRLQIEKEEYFIDLLFFNRKLQSLVAVELKKGKFKAEYVGKMNLYLSALDEYVKQPHENPSIGIILCKEKNNKIVEFALRDISKPMGVVIYKTYRDLPTKYKESLPKMEDLKKLL